MRRVATISLPDVPFRIALAAGRLYLLGRLKLLTYTVDATGALSLASDYPLPVNSFNPLGSSPNQVINRGFFQLGEINRSLAVRGNLLLAGVIDGGTFSGLMALDVTNAAAPQLLSTMPQQVINGVAAAGNMVYAVNTNESAVRAYDYTNPAAPVLRSSTPLPSFGYQVATNGSLLAVRCSNALVSFSLTTNPAQPQLVTSAPATFTPTRLALRGTALYENVGDLGLLDLVRAVNTVTWQETSRAAGPAPGNDLAVGDDALFVVAGPARRLIRYSLVAGGPTRAVTVNPDGSLGSLPLPTLSLSGAQLSISGGNTVTLPAGDNLGSHVATQALRLPEQELLLRPGADLSAGLGYYGAASAARNWNGLDVNGPALYGPGGGVLGVSAGNARTALRWNTAGNVGIGGIVPATRLDVDGALSLRPNPVAQAVTVDNQAIGTTGRSYVRLTSNSTTATGRTIVLANGVQAGQLLILENAGATGSLELQRSTTLALSAASLVLTTADVLTLVWNGSAWVQTSYSNN
jgi:hypothetical protein